MGERSQREAGRCAIISDLVTCSGMTPSPVDILCASQTNGLTPCSVAPFLSHRQAIPPLTHTCTHTHTHNTHPHTLLTHSINTHTLHTLTHTFYSHTLTASHTHTLTHSSHTHRHTPHTLTNTHPHILLTFTHTHTYRAYRSTDTGNMGTQREWSNTRHMECVGTAQSPS